MLLDQTQTYLTMSNVSLYACMFMFYLFCTLMKYYIHVYLGNKEGKTGKVIPIFKLEACKCNTYTTNFLSGLGTFGTYLE